MREDIEGAKVLVCEVGEDPTVKELGHKLIDWQTLVDGMVEVTPLGDGIYILCDENGISDGKPFNRDVLARAPNINLRDFDHVFGGEGAVAPGEMGIHRMYGTFAIVRLAPEERADDSDDSLVSLTDEDIKKYTELLSY